MKTMLKMKNDPSELLQIRKVCQISHKMKCANKIYSRVPKMIYFIFNKMSTSIVMQQSALDKNGFEFGPQISYRRLSKHARAQFSNLDNKVQIYHTHKFKPSPFRGTDLWFILTVSEIQYGDDVYLGSIFKARSLAMAAAEIRALPRGGGDLNQVHLKNVPKWRGGSSGAGVIGLFVPCKALFGAANAIEIKRKRCQFVRIMIIP